MRLFSIPRVPLTTTPTPLQRAPRFERALGDRSPRIYVKRDDLTGLAFGGNKGRKLEYLVADALAHGATALITEGAAQSNHARMTAAAAVMSGLKCTLVLDARNGAEDQGNLLLDKVMGVDVRIVPGAKDRAPAMAEAMEELRACGETPYLIPTGGSVPIGALGYVRATLELQAQLEALGESPRCLYFATGSQGTLSGLAVGARLFNAPWEPVGISDSESNNDIRASAAPIIEGTLALLDVSLDVDPAEIELYDTFYGEAYGIPTAEGMEAIRLMARTEAIFLDPVYSGKAMSGLIAHIRDGRFSPDESVIFLHSGGGPSLFANRDVLLQYA